MYLNNYYYYVIYALHDIFYSVYSLFLLLWLESRTWSRNWRSCALRFSQIYGLLAKLFIFARRKLEKSAGTSKKCSGQWGAHRPERFSSVLLLAILDTLHTMAVSWSHLLFRSCKNIRFDCLEMPWDALRCWNWRCSRWQMFYDVFKVCQVWSSTFRHLVFYVSGVDPQIPVDPHWDHPRPAEITTPAPTTTTEVKIIIEARVGPMKTSGHRIPTDS